MSTDTVIRYPSNQFLSKGVLYISPRQYLTDISEGAGVDAFTQEMWDCTSFDDLFALLAERTVNNAIISANEEASGFHNLILNTDSYKISHFSQYPDGTEYVYSYIESRGGQYDDILFFGLQTILKEYLSVRVTKQMVRYAEEIAQKHGEPFNKQGWDYVVEKLGGRIPVEIKAVPEGTILPVRNVLATIVNTDPKCPWITSYIEALLLRVWFPITVATRSLQAKRVIKRYLDLTSDRVADVLPFRLHDFGARGVSSTESAAIGGLAHLVNFMGSDTVPAILAATKYYNADMAGYSIPAAEHSTITSWGREREVDAYRNMLRQFARPGSLVAVVSDSWDLWNAIDNIWGVELRQHVIDSGATLVVRPDSGDVRTVPVEAVKRLDAKFGSTLNSKGFKVINHVTVIQGDGIDDETVIDDILNKLTDAGYSAENISFGMGGGLLQKLNRDTQKFAMKCSAICIDGTWEDVYKDPVTDPGKRSKRGRLALVNEGKGWETVALDGNKWKDRLITVWKNGELLVDHSFDEVRRRASKI